MILSASESIAIIIICMICTFFLRALPFLVFGNRPVPKAVTNIGKVLPMAVMTTLVIYCVRDVSFTSLGEFLPTLCGLLATTVLHLWRKSTFLSIVGGTACYMVLIRML